MSGTIGRANTGSMSGGNYTLTGGFWGVVAAVQTPRRAANYDYSQLSALSRDYFLALAFDGVIIAGQPGPQPGELAAGTAHEQRQWDPQEHRRQAKTFTVISGQRHGRRSRWRRLSASRAGQTPLLRRPDY